MATHLNKQRGSVLIFTVLMLGSILAISVTLAAIFLPKIRSITNAGSGSVGAIYAADSALEWCIYTNRGNPPLPSPHMDNGATYDIRPTPPPDYCTAQPMNDQVIGSFQGVSRSLYIQTPATPTPTP